MEGIDPLPQASSSHDGYSGDLRARRPAIRAGHPRFNNRYAVFELIEVNGKTRILYRTRRRRPFRPEILEAARIVQQHPCPYIPRIYDIQPDRIIGEYLDDFAPLSKAGVTCTGLGTGRRQHPRRFRRRRLRPYLLSVREHFDRFVEQLTATGRYLEQHQLWHDDVIPQNVMWHLDSRSMRLVDIKAFFPRQYLDDNRRLPYTRRRDRGVFRLDYTVDVGYVRDLFLQDLDPWPLVLLRKAGLFVKD